jgi:two-component system, LytTR family, response regulator
MNPGPRSIRVLVADDEPLARRGIEQLLAAHPDCRIVAACRDGRETVRALRTARPDIAFLDIQMPGLDGFEALDSVGAAAAPVVIFVTAYDEFAVRAFEERALDYLLKPVSQERFDRALERARTRLESDDALRLTRELAAFIGGPGPRAHATTSPPRTQAAPADANGTTHAPRVVVRTGTGELVLDDDEIDWIEALDYCAAVHAGGRRHVIRESLTSLERRLDARRFVRIHRSAIVRIARVRELRTSAPDSLVILRDGTKLPVSRRRRERVAAVIRAR